MDKDWEIFTEGVERDQYGQPVLLSRWGWKKEEIEGKTYLVATSEAELTAVLSLQKGRVVTLPAQYCYGGNSGCVPGPGCSGCYMQCDPRNGYCTCFCVG